MGSVRLRVRWAGTIKLRQDLGNEIPQELVETLLRAQTLKQVQCFLNIFKFPRLRYKLMKKKTLILPIICLHFYLRQKKPHFCHQNKEEHVAQDKFPNSKKS
jgi:hypothetical protein